MLAAAGRAEKVGLGWAALGSGSLERSSLPILGILPGHIASGPPEHHSMRSSMELKTVCIHDVLVRSVSAKHFVPVTVWEAITSHTTKYPARAHLTQATLDSTACSSTSN